MTRVYVQNKKVLLHGNFEWSKNIERVATSSINLFNEDTFIEFFFQENYRQIYVIISMHYLSCMLFPLIFLAH